MEKIMKIAHDYNLYVVEDSAEAHGIKPVGDIACFSLYGNKIITSGEGGVCLANDPRLAEQMKHLRGCAFDPQHSFLHKKMAYNFRMTNMQAAVAFAQVERIDEILAKRREVEKWYDEGLADIKQEPGKLGVETLPRDVVWFYDIMVLPRLRDELMAYLKERGIETRLFFKPMSQQPQYLDPDYPDRYLTVSAYRFSLAGLYLPTFTDMTKEQVAFVCKTIKEFFVWMQEKESTSQS
jgi:dTDP-4-amino-4,6-dideoxygalactose transaminase